MKIVKIVGLLSFVTFTAWSQAKYDKAILAIETTFETGDYNKAISALEKFKKKNFKKLGEPNPYLVKYYLITAKCNLASGRFADFESNVKTAISKSLLIDQEASQKHGLLLLSVAELYTQNGSYRVARTYLEDAKRILDKGAFFTKETKTH